MNEVIIKAAKRHLLKTDKVMAGLIRTHKPYAQVNALKQRSPYFHVLVQSIINQQLSVKAAHTISQRLLACQGSRFFNADKLYKLPENTLRNCGISRNKIRYIKAIATAVMNNELNFRKLVRQDDDAVRDALTQLPGIGRWSADMFLMSALKRPDVLPLGDLVLRKSMQRYYTLAPECRQDEYLRIAEPWRPYRTIACRYLWSAL